MDAEWVQAIAEIVTALTAAVAVIAARSELKGWRRQRREEKMAEVAGQALVAASELWTALRVASSRADWDEYMDDSDYISYLVGNIGSRVEPFRQARIQAEVFLSPATNVALEELFELKSKICSLLEAAESKCGRHGMIEANTEGVDELFDALQGPGMLKLIERRVEAVRTALRPHLLYAAVSSCNAPTTQDTPRHLRT